MTSLSTNSASYDANKGEGDDSFRIECMNNILKNINRNLVRTFSDVDQVDKLMAMRNYLNLELQKY